MLIRLLTHLLNYSGGVPQTLCQTNPDNLNIAAIGRNDPCSHKLTSSIQIGQGMLLSYTLEISCLSLPDLALVFALVPSVQFISVTQSCPTLCDPMNRSTSGLPVHHQLPEFTQTHVHRVSDAIQPSHPLSSPSLPAPKPSQHQGLFQ